MQHDPQAADATLAQQLSSLVPEDPGAWRVAFVCLGNICRSPLAEGLLQQQVESQGLGDHYRIASRGTGDWHLGAPADPRMCSTALAHGLQLNTKSELFEEEDFGRFDLILCMDRARFKELRRRRPPKVEATLGLFRELDPQRGEATDVPDPYYKGGDHFEEVFQIVARGCTTLLAELEARWISISDGREAPSL